MSTRPRAYIPAAAYRNRAGVLRIAIRKIPALFPASGSETRRFIEMCFDPQSPMNGKLKETLFRMMEGEQ